MVRGKNMKAKRVSVKAAAIFDRSPHPLKPLLKEHGVTCGMVARFLGLNYYYVSKIIAGDIKATPKIEKKLESLSEQLTSVDK